MNLARLGIGLGQTRLTQALDVLGKFRFNGTHGRCIPRLRTVAVPADRQDEDFIVSLAAAKEESLFCVIP
jgi:hypothetical protein